MKNSQYSIDFLTRWLYDEDLYANNPQPYWWDQGVLIDMCKKNILDIQQNSTHVDYGVLQHFREKDKSKETFIFHLAGRDPITRYNVSKQYYDNLMTST